MRLKIIEEFPPHRVKELYELVVEFSGWEHRTLEDVRQAVDHTDLVIGLVDMESDSVIAAARVLTDQTYYAKIYDVIVSKDYRQCGIGQRLISEIVDHPLLADVSVLQLACRDGLVPFYRKIGFEPVETVTSTDGESKRFRLMQRTR